MKNISVFTVLVIITGLFFSNNFAYSDDFNEDINERRYEFSIGPQIGFIHGLAIEIVYPSNTQARLLSELRWDMKPVFYCGIFMDFKQSNMTENFGFYASLSFKAGIPGISGYIENRDWISYIHEELTHYSIHDNRTRGLYMLDVSAGASFPLRPNAYIIPHLHFSWMHFNFSGSGGYGIYGSETSPGSSSYHPIDMNAEPNYFFNGEIIRYRQNWLLLSAGFIMGFNISPDFSFDFSFNISPLTYCAAVDNHLHPSKLIDFHDYTIFGLYIEPSIALRFTVNRIRISFDGSYRHIGRTRGPSYHKAAHSNFFVQGGYSGAALSIIDCRLLFAYSF